MNKIKKLIFYFFGGLSSLILFFTLISVIYSRANQKSLLFESIQVSHRAAIFSGGLLFLMALLFRNFDLFERIWRSVWKKADKQHLHLVLLNWPQSISLICIHIILFAGLSYYYFWKFQDSIFLGVDGDYMVSLYYSQSLWNSKAWYFTGNFLQGLGGNIVFPLNTLIDPGYYLSSLLGSLNYPFAHVVWGVVLFISTFLFSRTVGVLFPVALLAAWLVPIQILYPQPLRFYSVASLIPHISTVISLCLVALSAICLNKTRAHWLAIRFLAIVISAVYLLLCNPNTAILIFPLLLTFAALKIIFSDSPQSRSREVLMFLLVAIFIAATGAIPFIVGLFLDSASVTFSADFDVDRGSLIFASTMFSEDGYITIPLAVLGLVLLWKRRSDGLLPWFPLGALLYAFAVLAAGILSWLYPQFWRLPSPVYFEFFVWPIYCVGVAYLLNNLLLAAYRAVKASGGGEKNFLRIILKNKILMASFPSLVLIAVIFTISLKNPPQRAWPFPPPESPVMDRLVRDLSHNPGDEFKGRVATFTGMKLPGSVSWADLQISDYMLLNQVGNDFRKAGLWINSIPTLTEYSPHITPRLYYFATQFFLRPGDRQIRNMITLRSLDKKILGILGVTHVVTDAPDEDFELLAEENESGSTILLYGLDGYRRGLSPVNLIYFENIRQAMVAMKSSAFDFETSATVERPMAVPGNLVPATESKITINGSSYRVTASSNGQSVLVLPIEYSSCFDVRNNLVGGGGVNIFPANGLMMSVIFSRKLDISLEYANGIFRNPGCRFEDYAEFKSRL